MPVYIHQLPQWPQFNWDQDVVAPLLAGVRYKQGRLLGRMESLGFSLQVQASLATLTLDVLKSSEIEGEVLNADAVRSSVARRLGIELAGLPPADRYTDEVVQMMLDATQHSEEPLSAERLFGWQSALFPTGMSGLYKIVVGAWRNNTPDDPMQVVSGAIGHEKVHFEAPDSSRLETEMKGFINWFNEDRTMDPVLKAAVAHLWFVTIHPFDDGNGRLARALTDMQLSRADGTPQRFYSMSAQIRKERNSYYDILESTQKDSLDITDWITWFLNCLDRALGASMDHLQAVLQKARFWEKHAGTPLNERQQVLLNKLLDGFEGKLTSSKWAKLAKTSQDTALRDIQDLVTKNMLVKDNAGGRSTGYLLAE